MGALRVSLGPLLLLLLLLPIASGLIALVLQVR